MTLLLLPLQCTHCLNKFTPSADTEGNPVFADDAGNVCCNLCYCERCGHGHPTDGMKIACETEDSPEPVPVLATWPALASLTGKA